MEESNREYTRVNDSFNVRLVRKGEGAGMLPVEIDGSRSVNVSGSGLLVSTDQRLDTGSILSVTFMKPNSFDFFKGTGRVVRAEQDADGSYRIAINFVDLTPEDMKALNYYITLKK